MRHDIAWLILGIGIGAFLDGLIFDLPWARRLTGRRRRK